MIQKAAVQKSRMQDSSTAKSDHLNQTDHHCIAKKAQTNLILRAINRQIVLKVSMTPMMPKNQPMLSEFYESSQSSNSFILQWNKYIPCQEQDNSFPKDQRSNSRAPK